MKRTSSRLPPALAELLPAELHTLCTLMQAGKGERLFATGRKPAFMFFVVDGEVTLERLGRHGESVVLQRSRQGFVAEASLNSPRYHCDARAVADSTLVCIPIRELRATMDHDPMFAMRWIDMLNSEVKRLRLQCERLSLNGVQHRLIHLIETEGAQGRYPLGSGLKSVAKELGVTHEALYRCVAALEKSGVLLRDKGQMHLLKIPAA
jgi:CRP-like cAMP-binding protein